MPLDKALIRDLLQTLAEETFDFWKIHKKFGDGRPYANANTSYTPGAGELNLFSLSNVIRSNHETLAIQNFLVKQNRAIGKIWRLILDEAECLDVHGISMDIEFFNMGKMAARGEAPYPDEPQLALSFLGIGLFDHDTTSTPHSADILAERLCEITASLKDAPACCDRIFDINDAHIPAQDAKTALHIWCALQDFDLHKCLSNGFPIQVSVSEVLEPADLLRDLVAEQDKAA